MESNQAVVEVENYAYATSQLAQTTLRSVCGQAELDELLAERERRAKVIHADGEYQASTRLSEAAATISKDPAALQLRFLQTLSEVGMEKNLTLLFPIPVDLLKKF